eukprot:3315403-Pleurochrysis_carterae.AAC.1
MYLRREEKVNAVDREDMEREKGGERVEWRGEERTGVEERAGVGWTEGRGMDEHRGSVWRDG